MLNALATECAACADPIAGKAECPACLFLLTPEGDAHSMLRTMAVLPDESQRRWGAASSEWLRARLVEGDGLGVIAAAERIAAQGWDRDCAILVIWELLDLARQGR